MILGCLLFHSSWSYRIPVITIECQVASRWGCLALVDQITGSTVNCTILLVLELLDPIIDRSSIWRHRYFGCQLLWACFRILKLSVVRKVPEHSGLFVISSNWSAWWYLKLAFIILNFSYCTLHICSCHDQCWRWHCFPVLFRRWNFVIAIRGGRASVWTMRIFFCSLFIHWWLALATNIYSV